MCKIKKETRMDQANWENRMSRMSKLGKTTGVNRANSKKKQMWNEQTRKENRIESSILEKEKYVDRANSKKKQEGIEQTQEGNKNGSTEICSMQKYVPYFQLS